MNQLDTISQGLQTLGGQAVNALSLPSQAVEQLSSAVVMRSQVAATSVLQNWLDAHPIAAWMLHHPIWALALIGFLVIMAFGLLGAIARLTENIWLSLLQTPIKLSQWLFKKSPRLIQHLFAPQQPNRDSKQQLLDAIHQLEELRKEQDKVLEQIKQLLPNG
ncbi:hypothetical protein [Myxacorys almedinensis]|uniref:Uncharacterized protein n=1 Tax=Myxacorys almedinensis A TaxID=2690445 RepID=A0A8J7Z4A5_9CYAN|nr:hypothetical protein [Myxacorys almedinensis]NDJ17858.1 hypothetical protein [Myxacorys almedinensis A]